MHDTSSQTTSDSPRPIGARLLRAAAGVSLAAAGLYVALIIWVFGHFAWTGCFFDCSTPHPVRGAILIAGAAGVAALSLAAGVWGITGVPMSRLQRWMAPLGIVLFAVAMIITVIEA
jgi:hypothetical protein